MSRVVEEEEGRRVHQGDQQIIIGRAQRIEFSFFLVKRRCFGVLPSDEVHLPCSHNLRSSFPWFSVRGMKWHGICNAR